MNTNSSQVAATPTRDLVGHWKFDEASGNLATDASGNNNTGTLVNAPTRVAGKLGTGALLFSAASQQYVTVASSSSLNNPVGSITLAAWVDDLHERRAAGERRGGGTVASTSDPLAIARKNGSGVAGDYFNGQIDDVRIYNRALSGLEIATLMTNSPPAFVSNPFSKPAANAGQPYSGTIATNATDANGDAMTFAKVSGPAWLTVASNGALSGTPFSANVGTNSFLVRVTDSGSLSNTATMNITVLPGQPINATISPQGGNLLLRWTGGIPPYQVQVAGQFLRRCLAGFRQCDERHLVADHACQQRRFLSHPRPMTKSIRTLRCKMTKQYK